MRVPDWQNAVLQHGVFSEPGSETGRLVLWLAGNCDRDYQYWHRVSNLASGTLAVERGPCATPAIVIPTRQRLRGWAGKILGWLRGARPDDVWTLPNGETAELAGQRRGDAVLVWPERQSETLEEDRVRSRWPEGEEFRRLGPS